ncbi:MAG TPA: FtsQ-type POTRA domain-containing protein [Candidatus Kapabacteria bacterium]|nr:FtsQ-type POTRA domain-containing protein [Candidatus Kapabacteria bacterium]
MFGKSKKYERQWKLEVRSRSKPLKALRLKMAASALAISAGVVLALLVCWKGGEFMMERYVYTNPALGIRSIQVSTDGIIPVGQIRTWAGVTEGQNLLGLDLARIKRDLELVPLIEAASLERVLPRELIIRVREREPIARVHVFAPRASDSLLEQSSIYLDEHGMVIPAFVRNLNSKAFDDATRSLPVITGVGATAFRPGHIVPSLEIRAALKWIRAFQASGMTGVVDVKAIDVSSPTSLLVSTEQANEVSFPYHNFERHLLRWQQIHQFGRRQNQVLASLDLVVTNYVPVVWAQLTNEVPATVRIPQPSPYRKKHV